MKLTALSSSVLLALLPISGVYAAAMDRSGQSISAFLQPNNYFEGGISILDPDVSGQALDGSNISDMADDYYFPSAALKLQLTDNVSFGLLYDQPFGAKTTYVDGVLNGTEVDVKSDNLSMIFGFQPNENLNIYAGGAYQRVKGSLVLSGTATSLLSGYEVDLKEDGAFGWLAGVAYQIPEIALKASLTYRSKIDHELETVEDTSNTRNTLAYLNAVGALPPASQPLLTYLSNPNISSKDTKLSTPQSVNLDFQTGIMKDTVAFANVRWVNWKDLKISVDNFSVVTGGKDLLQYAEDQWSANVGVGRKLSEKWAGNVSVGWDSGAGNPVTALGPTEGYWNVGLGAQFSPAPNYFIAGGVKYFWLGDAKGQLSTQAGTSSYVADFEDNHAIAYGLKIGYKF